MAAEFIHHAIGLSADALCKHRLAVIVFGVTQHFNLTFVFEATALKISPDALRIDAVQRLAGFLWFTAVDRYVVGQAKDRSGFQCSTQVLNQA